jgi:uncharacterized protein (TIGR02246 family)
VYEHLQDAFNAGDLDRLMELYEPDAALVAQPGEAMAGTEQVRAALQAFLALNGQVAFDIKDVTQAGDVALAMASWSLTGGTDANGQPVSMGGVSADVMRYRAGAWRYAIDQPWGDQVIAAS